MPDTTETVMTESASAVAETTETSEEPSTQEGESRAQASEESSSQADWKKSEEYKRSVQEEANRLFQKDRDRARKAAERQKLEQAVEDRDLAHELAKEKLDEYKAEDRKVAEINAKAAPLLDVLTEDEDYAPLYAELYKKVGAEEMNRRYNENRFDFAKWALKETRKLSVAKDLPKVAGEYVAASAEDAKQSALRNVPTPPTGGGRGNSMPNIKAMSLAEFEAREAELDRMQNAAIEKATGRRVR